MEYDTRFYTVTATQSILHFLNHENSSAAENARLTALTPGSINAAGGAGGGVLSTHGQHHYDSSAVAATNFLGGNAVLVNSSYLATPSPFSPYEEEMVEYAPRNLLVEIIILMIKAVVMGVIIAASVLGNLLVIVSVIR